MENPEKRKKGRPALPAGAHRKTLVKAMFSDEEIKRLDKLRGATPRARYARQKALLIEPPKGVVDRNIFGALARVGNNINQIARTLNEGGKVTDIILAKEYESLKEILDNITGK